MLTPEYNTSDERIAGYWCENCECYIEQAVTAFSNSRSNRAFWNDLCPECGASRSGELDLDYDNSDNLIDAWYEAGVS